MQGLSINELRARGESARHALGVNTCVRCSIHYCAGGAAECAVHLQDARLVETDSDKPAKLYPCCSKPLGSKGCTPTTHLPTFQTIEGKVQPTRRIEYDAKADLKVGRWTSTRVSLDQLGSSSANSAASASPAAAATAAASIPQPLADLGTPIARTGDEIMVCGQMYHTGTPVILWGDVDGYDGYRVERRFCPIDQADWATTQAQDPETMTSPNRFGLRKVGLTPEQIERVRGGGWDLPTLQQQLTQFVFHFDECGVSRECFRTLQDERDLSIHVMCDLDGVIYQALDLKERAWQATTSNTCSIGVEIANIGAYPVAGPTPFADWYGTNAQGETIITIPASLGDGGIHTPGFVGQPARPNPVPGMIQGQELQQYDYTPQQYAALTKLAATFCTIFPKIPCNYPRDPHGDLVREKLSDAELKEYHGLLGHYHIQTNKIDPGPAFQWDTIISGARHIMAQATAAKAAAAAASASGAPAASSITTEQVTQWNLLRKMERKLVSAAEETAARNLSTSEPFYLVEGAWWREWQAWLECKDGSIARPAAVTNGRLLEADERTPKSGLVFGRNYKTVSRSVWLELVELYGHATPIVRATTDIYAGAASSSSSSSVAAASKPSVASPPAYAAASASAASGGFVVPEVSLDSDDPWMLVSQRQ